MATTGTTKRKITTPTITPTVNRTSSSRGKGTVKPDLLGIWSLPLPADYNITRAHSPQGSAHSSSRNNISSPHSSTRINKNTWRTVEAGDSPPRVAPTLVPLPHTQQSPALISKPLSLHPLLHMLGPHRLQLTPDPRPQPPMLVPRPLQLTEDQLPLSPTPPVLDHHPDPLHPQVDNQQQRQQQQHHHQPLPARPS